VRLPRFPLSLSRVAGQDGGKRLAAALSTVAAPAAKREAVPWPLIYAVGGLCWMMMTGTAVLWMLPYGGTVIDGAYVMTPGARFVQHLMVFLIAAPGYRVALAVGWPEDLKKRLGAVLFNLLLGALVVTVSPFAAALAVGLIDGRHAEMSDALFDMTTQWPHPQDWLGPLRAFLPSYVLGLCAIALVQQSRRRHQESLRAAEFARAYSAARLATLSAQLQPHFLFNSLNAISALIHKSPAQASSMVSRLGDFLRYALENAHLPWVALDTDLEGLGAYLALQRTRFADRLDVAVEASAAARRVYVPSLLLQPLVENAIEHGQLGVAATLHVHIGALVRNERLCITVHNSHPNPGRPVSPADFGHGLSNVAMRLQAAYDGAARLSIRPDPAGGTAASLELPLRSRESTLSQRRVS
jgi:Histidine kinase